jgi:conjugative transposon TraM protein
MESVEATMRKRKMLLVWPLLVVPCLTLLFWALGGGKGSERAVPRTGGINLNLPGAALKEEKGLDKLSFYDLAQKDSIQLGEQLKADGYWKEMDTGRLPSLETTTRMTGEKFGLPVSGGLHATPYGRGSSKPEEELLQKIGQLQKGLEAGPLSSLKEAPENKGIVKEEKDLTHQVDRLEAMMQAMQASGQADGEMAPLQATLETLLDVQHPDRVRERLKEKSLQNKGVVYPVTKSETGAGFSLLDSGKKKIPATSGFFSLLEKNEKEDANAIEAMVQGTQTLVDGGTIRLRLLQDVWMAGTLLPREVPLYGTASLNGERLGVSVTSIRYKASLYPVDLEVYDLDGLPGIAIPGAMTRQVAKESVNEASSLIGMASLDPSLKAQAAGAGLEAVKKLISKKAKLVKVTVKNGYTVLLKAQNH